MHKSYTFIIILFVLLGFQNQNNPDYEPMFFSMNNEWKDIVRDELSFEFVATSLDTTDTVSKHHKVRLLSNSGGEPMLFFSEIETSVCADGECKLANINVFWNLLGNYVGFGIPPKFPLTKYEHDRFEKEDYVMLHKLLTDDNSILKRRKMSDLIDKTPVLPSNINSKDIDGITGATKIEIKESVVKGGLYSCYTIWHLVHGEVKKEIKKHLQSIHSDTITQYFLNTPYKDYQGYALKKLSKDKFKQHSSQIIKIFKTTDASTKAYILKKIPNAILSEEKMASQLYRTFPNIDINSRTLLIKKLKNAHPNAVEIVSEYADSMTKNQLNFYLKYLKDSTVRIDKKVKSNLKKVCNSSGYAYSYLIKEFLKNE